MNIDKIRVNFPRISWYVLHVNEAKQSNKKKHINILYICVYMKEILFNNETIIFEKFKWVLIVNLSVKPSIVNTQVIYLCISPTTSTT